MFNIGLTK